MNPDIAARKAELIENIADAVMDMERHAQAHIEAQLRVVALRTEYDHVVSAERQNARAAAGH